MALSRLLLLLRHSFHSHKIGLSGTRRWSSSVVSGGTKKSSQSTHPEKGAVAKGSGSYSFARKYVEMASEVSPEATEVKNEVGGSWSIVKGYFSVLKEKILGNHESETQFTAGISDPTASDSKVITQNSSLNTDIDQPQNLHKSSEASIGSSREGISKSARLNVMKENSSKDVVDTTSVAIKLHRDPDNSELGEHESIVQSLKAEMDSPLYEKNNAMCVPSRIIMDDLSNVVLSHNPKLVKPKNAHRQVEGEKSGLLTDADRKLKAESLYGVTHQLLTEAFKPLQKDDADELPSTPNSNSELGKKTTFIQTPYTGPGVNKMPASSGDAFNVGKLSDLLTGTVNNQGAGVMASKKRGSLMHTGSLENSSGTSENLPKSCEITRLIDCIKDLSEEHVVARSQHVVVSGATDQFSNMGSTKKIQLQSDSGKSGIKYGTDSLLKDDAIGKERNKLNESNDEQSTEIPLMMHIDEALSEDKSDTGKGSTENKVLIRFLKKSTPENHIILAFEKIGPIDKIQEISSTEERKFKAAYVHFKTKEGMQNALKKQDIMVKGYDVLVEATSLEDISNRIAVPNLIGDPDVPVALAKNPTRTVMIKCLDHDISSNLLKEVLAFCGSSVSSIFWGSSSSVAYVEFETEDAKERAIAKHSIYVSEKRLEIFRIDIPRTTVVRVSNVLTLEEKEFYSICKSYGKIKKIVQRCEGVKDVYFKLGEWPNMLNILNRLNGKEVMGYQWLAQPAPIFPPDVLQILWSQTDERRCVKAVLQSLLRKLKDPVDLAGLN